MIGYLVMRLDTKLKTSANFEVGMDKDSGLIGVLPVFNSEENAKEASQDGRFQIVAISFQTEGVL